MRPSMKPKFSLITNLTRCIPCESHPKDTPGSSKIYAEQPSSMKPKIWNKIFLCWKHMNVVEIRAKIQCRRAWEILQFRSSGMWFPALLASCVYKWRQYYIFLRHQCTPKTMTVHQYTTGSIFISFVFPQFTSFHSVFHSFHGLMNSINWPASSVWVFIAQAGRALQRERRGHRFESHWSPENLLFRLFSQLLKLRFTAMVTYSFHQYTTRCWNLCQRSLVYSTWNAVVMRIVWFQKISTSPPRMVVQFKPPPPPWNFHSRGSMVDPPTPQDFPVFFVFHFFFKAFTNF